jgi:hypothetical protein
MRKASALIQCILAVSLAIWGIKLLLPKRNVYGNPKSETLIMQCQIPSTEVIIRLYEGTGGMLANDWHTVTFLGGKSSFWTGKFFREKQFLYTYFDPRVRAIECRKDRVEILIGDRPSKLTLPLEQIKNKLIYRPMIFYRGRQEEASIDSLQILIWIFGVFLELISIWILKRSLKQITSKKVGNGFG